MSSLVFETYTQGDIHIEYFWDKYAPHYHCRVGVINKGDGLCHTMKDFEHNTKEGARRSYQRQVALAKKGEIL